MESPVTRLGSIVGAVLVFVSVLAGGAVTAAARTAGGIVPPRNPPKSIPAVPDFESSPKCSYGAPNSSAACEQLVLRAIARARRKEGLGAMRFRLAAFRKLSAAEQLFVSANLERVSRGLPPVEGLTRQLDAFALTAARAGEDPSLPYLPYRLQGGGSVYGYGSNWAGGSSNVLGSDYGWMYDDGPDGFNFECTPTNHSGCWGHRDNILSDGLGKWAWASPSACGGERYHFVMGAASTTSKTGWKPSQTELFVLDCGAAPQEYFTWPLARRLLGI